MHSLSRLSSPLSLSLASLLRRACLLALPAFLAGCAYSGGGLSSGASADQARATMGQPVAVHKAAPGAGYAESWEYPRGPMGRHTYMLRFDTTGKLLRVDQVLKAQTLAAIHYGTDDMASVRSLLGRPGQVSGPNRLYGGPVWDYFALDGQRKIILSVSFDSQGKAAAAGEAPDPEEFGMFDGAGATN